MLDALTKHNRKLKFLDISYNLIDIGILRSLRQLFERNVTLHYLSISGLHRFNQRATLSLSESLGLSFGLKLLDLKKTTRAFAQLLD
jgi:hypothetical protein